MRATERQQRTLAVLEHEGEMSVVDLSRRFDVSENTVRNDLNSLAGQGLVQRTHGGARLSSLTLPAQLRPGAGSVADLADVVARALAWVEDGDSLIIGDSPVCVALAERLTGRSRLRVITSSLAVAYVLCQERTNTVVLAGGELSRERLSTSGNLAEVALGSFHADKAFFSCTGVSIQAGLTERSSEGAQVRQAMKQAAEAIFILVESGRLGKVDLFPFGALDAARRIVTDADADLATVQALAEAGARVTICWDGGHKTYRPRYGTGRRVRIGFANLSHDVWFCQAVLKGLKQAAERAEGVELLVADNRNSPEVAIENAREFLRQEIDLLVEYEGTGAAIRPIRLMMREAEVPMLAVDIPILGATHIGCEHDAAGISAGHALGRYVRDVWGGRVDKVIWATSTGGATLGDQDGPERAQLIAWSRVTPLGESILPDSRFSGALETLRGYLSNEPELLQVTLAGGWVASEDAVRLHSEQVLELLPAVAQGERVVVLCLVSESALAFARAVRAHGRCGRFVVVGFGDVGAEVRAELDRPDSCLYGVVDLHPERYGERIVATATRLLRGEPVAPAVFVEHEFVTGKEVLSAAGTPGLARPAP